MWRQREHQQPFPAPLTAAALHQSRPPANHKPPSRGEERYSVSSLARPSQIETKRALRLFGGLMVNFKSCIVNMAFSVDSSGREASEVLDAPSHYSKNVSRVLCAYSGTIKRLSSPHQSIREPPESLSPSLKHDSSQSRPSTAPRGRAKERREKECGREKESHLPSALWFLFGAWPV